MIRFLRSLLARRGGPRRVPVLRQMNSVECGAACLAMVLGAYGRHTRVADLRERLGIGRDGANGLQLARVGRELGMHVRALRLDLDDLAGLRLPAIVHWKFSHYMVLERWTGQKAIVVDPASCRRVLDREAFSSGFTGVALELTPTERLEQLPARRLVHAFRFARSLMASSRPLLMAAVAASLILQMLMLVPALATKVTIDTVIGHQQVDLLVALGIGFLLLVLTQSVATYARASLLNHLRNRMDSAIMMRFFRHLLALPYKYFQVRSSGDLLLRLSSNSTIRELMTGQSMSLLIDGLFVLVYLVLLLVLAPMYAVIVLILGSALFIIVFLTLRVMRELTQQDVTAQAEAQSFAVETLNGAESVKAVGAEDEIFDRWGRLFQTQLQASLRARRLEAIQESLLGAIRMGAPMLLLWVGAQQVLAGTMTIGTALALNSLAGAMLSPMGTLANGTRQLQVVGTHLDRIRDVLDEQVEQDADTVAAPGELTGRVELRGVGLRYTAHAPWAVRGVDLTVPAGGKIALVGPTGSGKSTLAKLLLGLYEPSEGEVLFDGRSLDTLNYQELRRQCGVVTQEPAMFAVSLRENITMGRPHLGLAEVTVAAQRAQLYDEIMAMPMGFDTMLSDGGGGISGGQRQRLALARALVSNPSLLVLDEATSHLDVVTERKVEEVLSELRCTRIVVAHRLSTVRDADLIVVLTGGEVVQTGRHDELMERGGAYEALVRDQLRQPVQEARPS